MIFPVVYSVKPDTSGVLRDDDRNPGSLAHFALHHFSAPMGLHYHIRKTQTQADAWLHHIRVSIAAIELRPDSLLLLLGEIPIPYYLIQKSSSSPFPVSRQATWILTMSPEYFTEFSIRLLTTFRSWSLSPIIKSEVRW